MKLWSIHSGIILMIVLGSSAFSLMVIPSFSEFESFSLEKIYTNEEELPIQILYGENQLPMGSTEPMKQIIFTDPRITDSNGNRVSEVRIGTQYQIASTVINQGNVKLESFTYQSIINRQGNNELVSKAWVAGSLLPGESQSTSLLWVPTETGTYDIQLHLFDTIELQNNLAPPLLLSAEVREKTQQEIIIDAYTSKSNYNDGDVVFVNGALKNYNFNIHSNNAVTYRVLDPAGNIISTGQTKQNSDGIFSFHFVVGGSFYKENGDYTIQLTFRSTVKEISLTYFSSGEEDFSDHTPPKILQPQNIEVNAETRDGITKVTFSVSAIDDKDEIVRPVCKPGSGSFFSIGETIVKCTAKDSAGNLAIPITFTIKVNPPGISIPDWVKNLASFWCQDKIDNGSFVGGIQYLINNNIIVIPTTEQSNNQAQEIPQWVKNNACWWSLGSISDEDFAYGIEYLVGQGIIIV